jgi:tRNA modification GTPase
MDAALATPPVERLRDGVRVVIAGPPNSGKSTLLNVLADRDAAIVSPISGTTRDRIEVPVVRDGIAYVLTDTAGLAGETYDPIERIGISRAEEAMQAADILLWLGDGAPPSPGTAPDIIRVHARADLEGRQSPPPHVDVAISVAIGMGLDLLWSLLRDRAGRLLPREDSVAMNQRQRSLIAACAAAVRSASAQEDLLLVAENLRLAMAALDALVGRSDVEAMLDALFRRFCLGK